MKLRKSLNVVFFVLLYITAVSQTNSPKVYFDKSGRVCNESISSYYRQETDTPGYFRSYYTLNNKIYFKGRLSFAAPDDESKNTYALGTCNWYFKNGNLKFVKAFNEKGLETGISRSYYESGKLWREIEFKDGKQINPTFIEYDEDGSKNKILEENFDNNFNEWDLYASDKSTSSISGGEFELISNSKEGTSRFINYPLLSDEYTIEASINIKDLKENDKTGIIFGFKDWQNYHYMVISKKSLYLGSVYEGVKDVEVDNMFSSAINTLGNNVIKILSTGEKIYYSINSEIQYTSKSYKMFGQNYGFVLSGTSKVKIEKFVIKEINVSQNGAGPSSPGPDDENISATGSGVIISKNGYLITNYHVIERGSKFIIELLINNKKVNLKAELAAQDKDNDLAILKINDPTFKDFTEIKYGFKESGMLDVGSSVFTIGFPHALSGMGKEAKFTDGKISAKTGYEGAVNSFQSTIPVQPGNSGGPVFNNSGQLIGVVNAKINDADNVSYAIKLNYIKNLIELLSEKIELPSDNSISALSLEEKLKVLTPYVVLIKVK